MSRPPIKDRNTTQGLIGLGPIPDTAPVASFNVDGIFNLINTKGFDGFHVKSAMNPDRASYGAPVDPNTQAAFNGLIYYDVRPIKIVPYSLKLDERITTAGVYGFGTGTFNVSGEYLDERPDKTVQISHNDLIILNRSITVPVKELFEYNPTGPNTLNFRVLGVDILFDNEREYEEGKDFAIEEGEIVWLKDGEKPKFVDGKPGVLSISYYTNPIFCVMDLPHNIRIIPSNDVGHGILPRDAVYAPQLVVGKILTRMQTSNILDWKALPPLPAYRASQNTTGGSF